MRDFESRRNHRRPRRYLCAIALLLIIIPASFAGAAVVTQGPTVTMNPNMTTPLAGVVELETDVPTQVQLVVTSGAHSFSVDLPTVTDVHYIPVVGMKADRTYTIDVNLVPGGNVGTLFATTDPLPADFPTLTVVSSDPTMMEPGYTLTDCMRETGPGGNYTPFSMAVDNSGEVVWYTTHCLASADYLPSGEILYRNQAEAIIMDFVGNQKRVTLQFPGLGSHHDLERTPHGTFLSMDRQNVQIDSFPTSETDPLAPPAPATLRPRPQRSPDRLRPGQAGVQTSPVRSIPLLSALELEAELHGSEGDLVPVQERRHDAGLELGIARGI